MTSFSFGQSCQEPTFARGDFLFHLDRLDALLRRRDEVVEVGQLEYAAESHFYRRPETFSTPSSSTFVTFRNKNLLLAQVSKQINQLRKHRILNYQAAPW